MTAKAAQQSASATVLAVVIYLSHAATRPRLSKAKRAAMAERLVVSRFARPTLAEWIIDQELYDLVPLEPAERTTPKLRQHRKTYRQGYIIPVEELSRTGRCDQSVANSIRIWIGKTFPEAVRIEDVTVVVEEIPAGTATR